MFDLLTASDVRALAARLGVRPTKSLGQNFVVDPGTVRRIARLALGDPDGESDAVTSVSGDVPDDGGPVGGAGAAGPVPVVEVGPGLGSLTLALLEAGAQVTAVEIDKRLAEALPRTVLERAAADPMWAGASLERRLAERLCVVREDALKVEALPGPPPRLLVANLPYNVAVPVILRFLERFGSIRRALVMVQAEVADRLVAGPGSRVYGVPSAKVAWYATARRAGSVGRSVFWPVPRVDSALVMVERRPEPVTAASRADVFGAIDAAFSQRRKTLRSALAGWAGGAARAEAICRAAGVDPSNRGETLGIEAFAALAAAKPVAGE
ncbi:MAG: 16S rRNA (adenine(1518)-N(6)/adenine(1519)-N(6))-dimethyltransferase RsmA [Bifidobacteriaceae bacterium]|nr:16S rRNA (adenine(1518)-N(6)/adenine(1519)-N(6))-dimethyltransferase RsmA [Bifidobacteriaceae bacterium]